MRFFSHSKYSEHVTQGRKPWATFTRFLYFQGSCLFLTTSLGAQWGEPKFRQLEEILPTPNAYRTASGAPGESYWQQKADYDIKVELDDELQRIVGSEVIHYQNNSPDDLDYLWIQIDANLFAKDSDGHLTELAPDLEGLKFRSLRALLERESFEGHATIHSVKDATGQRLEHQVIKTMMRIDLPTPLRAGESMRFSIAWSYNIIDAQLIRARSGYEFFPEDGNFIYEMAQWFPRMAAYTDDRGWHHKQFLGSGEFTLEFGDYEVAITVPNDHIVAATGTLQNKEEVLSPLQLERLKGASGSRTPAFIVTPEEAKTNETTPATGKKTWVFQAENVRDFAFASSRKFIWDAMGHTSGDQEVMAMSFYPNEAEPLWSRYSTHAVAHTMEVYSRHSFDYPYPVAISVNGPVGGMEYPMICFNAPRPLPDGTYWGIPKSREQWMHSKYGLISVIIHEVGHNYFPMIVNNDERQWTWMDEGLNTFLQYLAEQEWEEDYPSNRGEPKKMVSYMTSPNQVPIMSNSESILQFGNNAYGKPATALNILRETILGRELFDFAFRTYSQRWQFKRPQPADLFRTLEDASGIDLDWFWRGWFYSTDHVDLAITQLTEYQLDTLDPIIDNQRRKQERDKGPRTISELRNEDLKRLVDRYPELVDFYNDYDPLDVLEEDRKKSQETLEKLNPKDRDLLKLEHHFYVVEVENIGGLVMPVILEIEYFNGNRETRHYPAEIWRRDSQSVRKLLITTEPIRTLRLDPHLQTADSNLANNQFPPKIGSARFELSSEEEEKNPMQKAAHGKEEAEETP
ncbi:MAG: M1 family metallopeptidase [Limisphaerales bacterium]